MSYLKILLTTLLLLNSISSFAGHKDVDAWGYPVLDSMISYLVKHYDAKKSGNDCRPFLAKRKDGWYLYIHNFATSPPADSAETKVWDRASGKLLLKQDTILNNDTLNADFFEYVKNFTYSYTIEPYYGYKGWALDVISALKDKTRIGDDDLFALGHAYSEEISNRIGNQIFGIDSLNFKLGDQPGQMTPAQIDTMRYYHNGAVEAYHRLWKQNPRYETLVGNIWVKYSNECITAYHDMSFLQGKEEARKFLKSEDLYDPVTLAYASNILNSCDKNAILFTNGDGDTYPLYYLQQEKGVRNDVLILNLSLLNTSIYINAASQGLLGTSAAHMDLHPEEYSGSKMDYLSMSNPAYKRFNHIEGIDHTISKNYLLKGEIAAINIIQVNNWQRPIDIPASNDFLDLDDYLLAHGTILQLQKKVVVHDNIRDVDTSFSYDFFMHKMQIIDWSHQSILDESAKRLSCPHQYGPMLDAARQYANAGRKKESVALVEKAESIFPEDRVGREIEWTKLPGIYFQVGLNNKAKQLAEDMLKHASADFGRNIKNEDLGNKDWDIRIRTALYVYQELETFYEGVAGFADKATEIKSELEKRFAMYQEQKQKRGINF